MDEIILQPRPYLMVNEIQNYPWGSTGRAAFIPRFLNRPASESVPYAELWMGAHPSAPSRLLVDKQEISLEHVITQQPAFILGSKISQKFARKLPFLLKILSAGQPLSIQAHPDKKQAASLHAADAAHYPDDNHKPEIAVAITEFRALAGFKSTAEICETLRNYPEIAGFIGEEAIKSFLETTDQVAGQNRKALRSLFSTYLGKSEFEPEALLAALNKLTERLKNAPRPSDSEQLFLQMQQSYSGPDAGLFCIFLLNHLSLQPGQAIFIPAGIPHAYLSGEIVECMANSDNVVRAGLTAKFQDKQNLLEILTFENGPLNIIEPREKAARTDYLTPVEEFSLLKYNLKNGQGFALNLASVAILLVLTGEIKVQFDAGNAQFYSGQSILLPAALQQVTISATGDSTLFLARPAV